MKERMNLKKVEPSIYAAMNAAEKSASTFNLDAKLMHLMKLRASQINGCGYCVNLHSKDARKAGETEQRVYAVSTWWEVPFYTDAERAALKLTEEITQIANGGLTEDTYQKALKHFDETQVAQLIFVVVVINSWNRIAISSHMVAELDK